MFKPTKETELMMSEQQRLELPRLRSRLELDYSNIKTSNGAAQGAISAGMKYVVHFTFPIEIKPYFCDAFRKEMGADGYFTGTILSKPATVFFFMPLFE